MAERRGPVGAERLVGRDTELRLLLDRVRGAAGSLPCACVVHGEAGIGKTVLARAAAEVAASEGFTVLWGAGLRFAAAHSTGLPLVMALEEWLRTADHASREGLVAAVDGAAGLLPSLGGSPTRAPPAAIMLTVDAALGRLASAAPVLLVVDDVQWADPLTRDCLTYLLASGGSRRLAVMITCRDEDVGPHRSDLDTWLADVRRLPGVGELPLGRLEAAATEEQLTGLLGRPPHPRVTAQVHARSAGVPYLTRLLVEDLDADAETLPEDLPEFLTQAVRSSWERLTGSARGVLQVLATAGAPVTPEQLVAASCRAGVSRTTVERAIAEGADAHIVTATDGRLWFCHPLLPQSLEGAMLPAQRATSHAAWADLVAETASIGMDELRRLGALAQHLELAGRTEEMVEASLRAADLARDLSARSVEAEQLLRAAGALEALDGQLAESVEPVALLERAARAAADVCDLTAAAALSTRALAQVDPADDPLTHARLLLFSAEKDFPLGRVADLPVAAYRRAVELTAPFPDDPVHADALTHLAYALGWSGQLHEARPVAEQAVQAARRCGSPAVLAGAYGTRSFVELGHHTGSDRDSALAVHFARQCDDLAVFSDAVTERSNCLLAVGRMDEAADLQREVWRRAESLGIEWLAAKAAMDVTDRWLELGLLREAAGAVRAALVPRTAPSLAAYTRKNAMTVAVRCGDLPAADQHLSRARELISALELIPGLWAPPALAEHLLAHGSAAAALDLLDRTLEAQVIDPRVADLMTMWASRAAADLAESARDRRDGDAARGALQRLDRFREHRVRLGGGPNEVMIEGPDLTAMAAVSAAELARCAGRAPASLWEEAAVACREAGLEWEKWLAELRLAEVLLVTDRHRRQVTELLRAVARRATEQGAVPLVQRATSLARIAGIPLTEPRAGPTADGGPFAGLTPRENEVLTHVVAGRTYHEIADALVISEKTVSVHVSNLLRKTGTASRRELAALAVRLDVEPPARLDG